ncbi:MAG: DUF11 domain-containing protein, partial [Chloroflexi bacterium]|nr:DUF11 domain-containing protein [Chloroflexota bacterium]
VFFLNATRGWAVGDGGVMLGTSDGGDTWAPIATGQTVTWYGVQFLTPLQGWIVGADGAILYTNNGGSAWLKAVSGTRWDLYTVQFIDAYHGWAAGGQGVILRYSYAPPTPTPTYTQTNTPTRTPTRTNTPTATPIKCLELTKDNLWMDPLPSGWNTHYDIVIRNTCLQPFTEVVLTDAINQEIMDFLSTWGDLPSSYNHTTEVVTWNIGTLDPGEEIKLYLRVHMHASTADYIALNTAVLTTKEGVTISATDTTHVLGHTDPTATLTATRTATLAATATHTPTTPPTVTETLPPATPTATATHTTTLLGAKLADPAVVEDGEVLTYTLVLMNDMLGGADPGTSVTLWDELPERTNYISGTLAGGATYDPQERTIHWAGAIPRGGSVTITFQVQVDAVVPGGMLTNTAYYTDAFGRTFHMEVDTQVLADPTPTSTATPTWTPTRIATSTPTATMEATETPALYLPLILRGSGLGPDPWSRGGQRP